MEFSGTVSGSAPILKKLQVGAAAAYVGIPHLIVAAAGVAQASTTGAADMIGCNLDTMTYSTTQGSGDSSAERLATFVVNSDAIWRARLSGGATSGTALTEYSVTTASSGGTAVTSTSISNWASPQFDQGLVWFYTGANVGQRRIITSTSGTTGTVTTPFDYGTVVGDTFLRAPVLPFGTVTAQLTTELYEVDASIAVGTGAPFLCIGVEANDKSNEGNVKSYCYLVAGDHYLNRLS